MKTKLTILALLATVAAHAGPRISASYSIATDTTDTGGGRTVSAAYTNDGSASAVAGLSTVASPAQTAKSGYVGQLYDVTGLVVNAGSSSVNEAATLQLTAWQFLDDESTLTVAANAVAWSVVSGPITGIDSGGLATADVVYQSTPATVQGMNGGFTGMLNLTVLDTIADNFGSYAGDGLGDDWQVQYFGTGNPLAAPGVDASGNGHTNLFKYIAGLDPLDPADRFKLRIEPVPGQPTQKRVIFSPLVAGRTYTVSAKATLSGGTFMPLGSSSSMDAGDERTVTDLDATGATKFYHVEISKP